MAAKQTFATTQSVTEKQLQTKPKVTKKKAPTRPDVTKKQKRVQKIVEDPTVQEKLKRKVVTKRARSDTEKVEKNGGDDSRKTKQQ